jgi:aminopeptidase N
VSDNSTETMLSFISLLSIFALVVSGESFPRRTNYVLPQELHRENLRILPKGRLSADVVPTDYAIRLTLESDAFKKNVFSGIVDIQFDINKDVSLIQLHAKDLNIIGVTLDKTGGIDIIMEGPDLETDLVTVTQINGTNFTKGTGYQLTITYSGILSETEMVGFYKSSYTDGTETKYLAATQFESTHARRAFPCFDEPALKATFTVTLTCPKTYTAKSNTDVFSTSEADE